MSAHFLEDERLSDLLVQRAVEGLDSAASAELAERAQRYRDYDDDAVDRIAAALSISGLEVEPMPTHLRDRLEAKANDWSTEQAGQSARVVAFPETPKAADISGGFRWLAAASVLVGVLGWYQAFDNGAERDRLATELDGAKKTLADTLDSLESQQALVASLQIQRAPDFGQRMSVLAGGGRARVIAWTHTEDPAALGARGELVWDNDTQEGYMRFSGLAPNNPEELQYQLWIFDETRDDRHPVDGGVFDMPAGESEVVVPIRAKLPVGKPVLFAITVERPGGVVVSSRERIALLAKPNQEI
ncbi:MAG: anti-sigma factor [Gammaproteobacteria bacterium]|nr:MAG: anti-sigma factor [Gammaproteobacteria bacterium]